MLIWNIDNARNQSTVTVLESCSYTVNESAVFIAKVASCVVVWFPGNY